MPRSLGGDKFARDEKERHLNTRTIRTLGLMACVGALDLLSPPSGLAQTRASTTSRGAKPPLLVRLAKIVDAAEASGLQYPRDSVTTSAARRCVDATGAEFGSSNSTAVVFFRAAHPIQSGNGDLIYPSAIHLPTAGDWLIVATAGKQWGCFALSLAESQ